MANGIVIRVQRNTAPTTTTSLTEKLPTLTLALTLPFTFSLWVFHYTDSNTFVFNVA